MRLCIWALALAAGTAWAQQQIKVSYQPALYWSLPYYIASEKGWWAELGLSPLYSTFPAGVPQIAASASKSWDVGGAGSVPAELGAARYNILTIGITNDESVGNALMATRDKAAAFMKNPQSIKGQAIVLTSNSTGDYAVQSCLRKWGLQKSDVSIKSMGQAEIISAMSSGNADLGGLWAPNIYTFEEKAGGKLICSGKDAGAIVPGALLARRKEAIAMMKKFYDQGGVTISEASMEKEFDTRPVYDLAQQLKIMDRSRGASEVDKWFTGIGDFMKANGTFPEAPKPASFITDEYLKMVDRDPKLKAFAN